MGVPDLSPPHFQPTMDQLPSRVGGFVFFWSRIFFLLFNITNKVCFLGGKEFFNSKKSYKNPQFFPRPSARMPSWTEGDLGRGEGSLVSPRIALVWKKSPVKFICRICVWFRFVRWRIFKKVCFHQPGKNRKCVKFQKSPQTFMVQKMCFFPPQRKTVFKKKFAQTASEGSKWLVQAEKGQTPFELTWSLGPPLTCWLNWLTQQGGIKPDHPPNQPL